MHSGAKHFFLPLFRVVTLDHANAAKRFGESPGDFRIDLGPRPENRPNGGEGLVQPQAENQHDGNGHGRHRHTDAQKNHQRDDRRHQASDELHESRADQVPDALDVAHDPGNQDARLVGVVKRHRQAPDVRLHLQAKLRNHPLRGFRQQLRQRERGQSLNHGGGHYDQHNRRQELDMTFADDVVHQVFRRGGKHQSRYAVDAHQRKAECEDPAPRLDEYPHVRQGFPGLLGLRSRGSYCGGIFARHRVVQYVRPFSSDA